MMTRIPNKQMGSYVHARREFTNHNDTAFAKHLNDLYVVWSYGTHFPMYVYDWQCNQWIGNKDKYSSTTSRHQSYARPPRVDRWMDTDELKHIVYAGGVLKAVTYRLEAA